MTEPLGLAVAFGAGLASFFAPCVLPIVPGYLGLMGFTVWATKGTAQYLRDFGVPCETAWRISEQRGPDAIGLMRKGDIALIINTPTLSRGARRDGYQMRRLAVELEIPFITTMPAAAAAVHAIAAVREGRLKTKSVAEYYEKPEKPAA
jgi:carbamoyl-phosphate synthase large subunit